MAYWLSALYLGPAWLNWAWDMTVPGLNSRPQALASSRFQALVQVGYQALVTRPQSLPVQAPGTELGQCLVTNA